MAEKRRFLDVWLVEPNTVYREVPFTVVTTWVEQSRLVPDDMIRPSGTAQWFKVGDSPDFKPYLPQADTVQIEDEAEALDSVGFDFTWKRRPEDDDDEVDMIPLIDVSLVLLVFVLLTATTATAGVLVNSPQAEHGIVTGKERMFWVNVRLPNGPGTNPVYSVSVGDNKPAPEDDNLNTITVAVQQLQKRLEEVEGACRVTIRADRDVESGEIRDLTVELNKIPKVKIEGKFIAVSEVQKQ